MARSVHRLVNMSVREPSALRGITGITDLDDAPDAGAGHPSEGDNDEVERQPDLEHEMSAHYCPQPGAPEERNNLDERQSPVRGAHYDVFFDVLGDTAEALEAGAVPYVLIGGIASSRYGRPRWTHDIDLLVKPEDAERALEQLANAGFETERTDHRWIYKGFKSRVMVDIIFKSTGGSGIHLDDEMIARAVPTMVRGHRLRLIPPEDLLVMKAAVSSEIGPRHWHDALSIISTTQLDWQYLERRAIRAPRRVLSLLIYAHSLDLLVPNGTIHRLYEQIYGS